MSLTKTSILSTTHAIFWGLREDIKNILRTLPISVLPRYQARTHRCAACDCYPLPIWYIFVLHLDCMSCGSFSLQIGLTITPYYWCSVWPRISYESLEAEYYPIGSPPRIECTLLQVQVMPIQSWILSSSWYQLYLPWQLLYLLEKSFMAHYRRKEKSSLMS